MIYLQTNTRDDPINKGIVNFTIAFKIIISPILITFTSLKYFIFMIIAIILANVIVILSEEHSKHSVSLWTLNITAATDSILCIIVFCRYGIYGLHSKSYLFLTLGIISWFSVDLFKSFKSLLYASHSDTVFCI